MALMKWNPKKSYSMQDPLDEFFNLDYPYFGLSLFPMMEQAKRGRLLPAIDVSEEKDKLIVNADIPGMKKEDINISIDGPVLTIRGERKSEVDQKDKNFHRVERSYGSFERSIDLGINIDQSKVKAKYADGVLSVTIPKSEKTKQEVINIE